MKSFSALFILVLLCLTNSAYGYTRFQQLFSGSCNSDNLVAFCLYSAPNCLPLTCAHDNNTGLYMSLGCLEDNTKWVSNLTTVYPNSEWLEFDLNSDLNCNAPLNFSYFIQLDSCKSLDNASSIKVFAGSNYNSFIFRNYTGTTCTGEPGYEREINVADNSVGACYYGTNLTNLPVNLNQGGVRYSIRSANGDAAANSATTSNALNAFVAISSLVLALITLIL